MTDAVTLTDHQVKQIADALNGITNLVKGHLPKSGNAAELYALMSNVAVIQTILTKANPEPPKPFANN
jgi:hypothetical protein